MQSRVRHKGWVLLFAIVRNYLNTHISAPREETLESLVDPSLRSMPLSLKKHYDYHLYFLTKRFLLSF